MIRITIKGQNLIGDYEIDPRQRIVDVLKEIYPKSDVTKFHKVRLNLSKRTIDVENTFLEMDIRTNEIMEML